MIAVRKSLQGAAAGLRVSFHVSVSQAGDAPHLPTQEPLRPNDLEGYARLRREGVPLATGEHLYTRWDVKPFLDAACVDFIQADPDWCGGITELVKICALSATYSVPVVPHGHNTMAAAHVIAAQSPTVCPMMEYLVRFMERQQYFHTEPIRPEGGFVTLPALPGLGIVFDEVKIEERREWPVAS